MIMIRKEISIHARLEKVFAFMLNPHNLPGIWPSMVEVSNVTQKPNGGYKFNWIYKMAGIAIEGASDTPECIVNKRIITQSVTGIESRFVWEFEDEGGDTHLSVEINYKVPIPLIGHLAESVIARQNDREAEILLENLKSRMEMETPVAV